MWLLAQAFCWVVCRRLKTPYKSFATINGHSLTKEKFKRFYDSKIPVVMTNALCRKLEDCAWELSLFNRLGSKLIQYDGHTIISNRNNFPLESRQLNIYEASLNEFADSLHDSDHYDNVYMMDEDILNSNNLELSLNMSLFGKNLFDYFPLALRPKSALIMGGNGARSFLHCDPFDWTGWNYLVKGRKLCKHGQQRTKSILI